MITTAVLLAAGEGSRLRAAAASKPLCPVGGKPLIEHAITGFAAAGLARVVVVLGYEAEKIEAHLASRSWPIAVETVRTPDYKQPNGVSVLAAEATLAGGEAVLAMCDHLVDPALYARVAQAGAGDGARLAIDRNIESDLVDLDDVTAVRTQGDAIVGIGKHLPDYDCFDTGVFAIGPGLFAALNGLASPSLTEGMRVLAAAGTALTIDCSDLAWIDVDDPAALGKAEDWLRAA
ncbi:NTP transferase domain-containing protein [Sphingomonas sp. HF-S4]|uniref:NTP transferase domain-containing protein n=1 Tax=Sphingomonas agrestis TaxID=3080540 RepID=A0ABU3Y217_9SPHN|nr:NTP transferase domain-containing protein [Sphingomonas sp. HF-S4]MDV3455424.1 NTP transferase domain-containing protein [Sphingomonas sp. HF-S4]